MRSSGPRPRMDDDREHRPDPDALLASVKAEEIRAVRARLKIFFGAAPGGGTKPRRIRVDELAHTNAPGSKHVKRWQDVLELLDAGIDVHTTVNVQHIESLSDVVQQITGGRVRETVPDVLLERADEIELVDISPEELLVRLSEGKVYVLEQAQRAVQNFFQKGNLLALRELALRRTAARVDAEVLAYRKQHGISSLWPTVDRIVVCVGPSPGSERLIRATKRIAQGPHSEGAAAHVEGRGGTRTRDK